MVKNSKHPSSKTKTGKNTHKAAQKADPTTKNKDSSNIKGLFRKLEL